jgi:cell division protein FtsN
VTRATTAAAALLAAIALGACGKDSGKPIPAKQASRLVTLLDVAARQADAGSCGTLLRDTIPSLERRARQLPTSVGADTRETINDGVAHLAQLATDQCNNKQQQQLPTTTQSTSTSTPSTTTTDTTTSSTTTDTTPTTTDTTPTTTDTTPTTTDTTPTTPGNNGGTPPGAQPGAGGAVTPPGQKPTPLNGGPTP